MQQQLKLKNKRAFLSLYLNHLMATHMIHAYIHTITHTYEYANETKLTERRCH